MKEVGRIADCPIMELGPTESYQIIEHTNEGAKATYRCYPDGVIVMPKHGIELLFKALEKYMPFVKKESE